MSKFSWKSLKRRVARFRRAVMGRGVARVGTGDTAEMKAARVFRSVLRREPDASGLATYSKAIASGRMSSMDLAETFFATPEFGVRALQHPPVARHLAATLIGHLMGRQPDEETVTTYAGALENGYSLHDFLYELTTSAEFRSRYNAGSTEQIVNMNLLHIGQLTEQLIGEELTKRGSVIGLPPQDAGSTPPSEQQVARLVRTLAMLAADQSESQSATEAA